MGQGRVDQISVPIALGDHDQRIQRLERTLPSAGPTLVPATIAWALLMTREITLPMTTGGAGYGGSDWAAPSLYHAPILAFLGVMDTNAANDDDPDILPGPTDAAGDLFIAGIKIYSFHFPLTDYGFVSGDNVASIRLANLSGTYKTKLRIGIKGTEDAVDGPANQIVAATITCYGGAAPSGGDQQADGSNYLMSPNSIIDNPDGTYQQRTSQAPAVTNPGDPRWNFGAMIEADTDGLLNFDSSGGIGVGDLVLRAWNPGPDDVIMDVAILVEKIDSSVGIFNE